MIPIKDIIKIIKINWPIFLDYINILIIYKIIICFM